MCSYLEKAEKKKQGFVDRNHAEYWHEAVRKTNGPMLKSTGRKEQGG